VLKYASQPKSLRSSKLVPSESLLAVLVMVSSKSGSIPSLAGLHPTKDRGSPNNFFQRGGSKIGS